MNVQKTSGKRHINSYAFQWNLHTNPVYSRRNTFFASGMNYTQQDVLLRPSKNGAPYRIA